MRKVRDQWFLLGELIIPIIPFPPLFVVRNSLSFVLFPNPFSVIESMYLPSTLPFLSDFLSIFSTIAVSYTHLTLPTKRIV